jgi:transposase-like protein
VRRYVAYPLSYRHVEELMQERGVAVDHATVNRWVMKYSPQQEAAFHRRMRPVWLDWRMDETNMKIRGRWRYLYRAVDKHGQTIDFLPMQAREELAVRWFLTKAIRRHDMPETITTDGRDCRQVLLGQRAGSPKLIRGHLLDQAPGFGLATRSGCWSHLGLQAFKVLCHRFVHLPA